MSPSKATLLLARSAATSPEMFKWESHWYGLYNYILIDSSASSEDVIVSPQYTLYRYLNSDSQDRQVVQKVIPDFILFRLKLVRQGINSSVAKLPVAISEGKKDKQKDKDDVYEQSWLQASYCFELHGTLCGIHLLIWWREEWEIFRLAREHRRTMSSNTDSGYDDLPLPVLPSTFTRPIARGRISNEEEFRRLISELTRILCQ